MAVARLGISTEEFWHHITPLELHYMFKAANKEIETTQRFEMEKMRLQTMLLLNIHLKPFNQFKSPKKLMKFAWEEFDAEDVEIWDEEQWSEMDERLGLKERK